MNAELHFFTIGTAFHTLQRRPTLCCLHKIKGASLPDSRLHSHQCAATSKSYIRRDTIQSQLLVSVPGTPPTHHRLHPGAHATHISAQSMLGYVYNNSQLGPLGPSQPATQCPHPQCSYIDTTPWPHHRNEWILCYVAPKQHRRYAHHPPQTIAA